MHAAKQPSMHGLADVTWIQEKQRVALSSISLMTMEQESPLFLLGSGLAFAFLNTSSAVLFEKKRKLGIASERNSRIFSTWLYYTTPHTGKKLHTYVRQTTQRTPYVWLAFHVHNYNNKIAAAAAPLRCGGVMPTFALLECRRTI